jgi:hypothetical protein
MRHVPKNAGSSSSKRMHREEPLKMVRTETIKTVHSLSRHRQLMVKSTGEAATCPSHLRTQCYLHAHSCYP